MKVLTISLSTVASMVCCGGTVQIRNSVTMARNKAAT